MRVLRRHRTAIVAAPAAAVALLVTTRLGLRGLDVASWSVVVPLAVATTCELVPRAVLRLRGVRRHRAPVVVPGTPAALQATPDPAVQAREAAREQARDRLLAARERDAPLEELLVLLRVLHEATLDVARATASAGGYVPQALRDELALRERAESVPSASG